MVLTIDFPSSMLNAIMIIIMFYNMLRFVIRNYFLLSDVCALSCVDYFVVIISISSLSSWNLTTSLV